MSCPLSIACCLSSIVPTDEGGHHNDTYQYIYRRHTEDTHKHHRGYPYQPRPPAHLSSLKHINHRHTNEGYHDGTYALEGLDDIRIILITGEEHRHQQDDKEGRQATGNGGHHTTLGAAQAVTGKDGDVDRKEPWRSLCQRDDIDKILIVQPASLYEFTLDGCYHGNASTNGESTNLSEYKKYLPKAYHKCTYYFASAKVQQAERRTKQTCLFFIPRRSVPRYNN